MEKQIITFSANEQNLIKTDGIDCYASNVVSYVEAHFDLGDNWSGYDSVRAVWYNDYKTIATVLDSQGVCVLPYEVLKVRGKVRVNLVGSIAMGNTLTDRLTTYPVVALTVNANAKVDGDNTRSVTPSQFEQFAAVVGDEAIRSAQSMVDAKTYMEDAKTYMEGSRSYAEIAMQESSNAASSARSASNASGASQSYAQNAYNSSQTAQNASESAQTYAQNASISAQNAETAKDDAEAARDKILSMRAEATTLAEGSQATASYSDGLLSLGIPKGDRGDSGTVVIKDDWTCFILGSYIICSQQFRLTPTEPYTTFNKDVNLPFTMVDIYYHIQMTPNTRIEADTLYYGAERLTTSSITLHVYASNTNDRWFFVTVFGRLAS